MPFAGPKRPNGLLVRQGSQTRLLRSNSPSTHSSRRVPQVGHYHRTPGALNRSTRRRAWKQARRRPDEASRCRERCRQIPAAAMPANVARRKTSLPPSRLPVRRANRYRSFWIWEASRHWRLAVISGGSCKPFPVARSPDRQSRHCRQARHLHPWCRPFSARLPLCRRRWSRLRWSRRNRRPPSGHLPQRRVRGYRKESSPAFRAAARREFSVRVAAGKSSSRRSTLPTRRGRRIGWTTRATVMSRSCAATPEMPTRYSVWRRLLSARGSQSVRMTCISRCSNPTPTTSPRRQP